MVLITRTVQEGPERSLLDSPSALILVIVRDATVMACPWEKVPLESVIYISHPEQSKNGLVCTVSSGNLSDTGFPSEKHWSRPADAKLLRLYRRGIVRATARLVGSIQATGHRKSSHRQILFYWDSSSDSYSAIRGVNPASQN